MKEEHSFLTPNLCFANKVIDKKELKKLIAWAFSNYGTSKTSCMADSLKELGFHYATKAGISISIEDLRVPPTKRELLELANKEIMFTEQQYTRGEVTVVEKFQKVIDTWNNFSETLKDEVIKYFKETDPLNPVYIMSFSGARGNISQVRQLVGMRGLMVGSTGQIIDLPIRSNFREGLTVTEYMISCYGARKGLVDTALRTADSGYLTRRLVDVVQDVIIRETNCGTTRGILLKDLTDTIKVLISLENRLIGRTVFETLYTPDTSKIMAHINQDLNFVKSKHIVLSGITSVYVRSPLTCESLRSICQFCYGWNLAHGSLVDLGEAVGIIAAQSIGEPGTQLTMRTFHTGGIFTGELAEQVKAPFNGIVKLPHSLQTRLTRTHHGNEALLLEEDITIYLYDFASKKSRLKLRQGTILFINDNQEVKKMQVIGEILAKTHSITEKATKDLSTAVSGEVYFSNFSVNEKVDRQGNVMVTSLQRGVIWILEGDIYNIPTNSYFNIHQGDLLQRNDTIATMKIISDYGGIVNLHNQLANEIEIINASTSIRDSIISVNKDATEPENPYILEFENEKKFVLHCSSGDRVSNSQTIGELIDTSYCVNSGGFIKYVESNTMQSNTKKEQDLVLYWVSEETHEVNKDASLLMIPNYTMVTKQDEIITDLYSSNGGLLCIKEEHGIVKEVIIKPGYLKEIDSSIPIFEPQFFEKEEQIPGNIKLKTTSFVELVEKDGRKYILIRPVTKYKVVRDHNYLNQELLSTNSTTVQVSIYQKVLVQDGENVKSSNPINLLKTYLILNIRSIFPHLSADVEFSTTNSKSQGQLKFTIVEKLSLRQDAFCKINENLIVTELMVENGDTIMPGTTVAETRLMCKNKGIVKNISTNAKLVKNILLLTTEHIQTISTKGNTLQITKGDLIQDGDQITESINAPSSGQIVEVTQDTVILRSGSPYLVSSGTILQVNNSDLIKTGDILAILLFERPKAGDIIQGLPRIEEILEARKPKEPCILVQKPGKINFSKNVDDLLLVKITENHGHSSEYIVPSSHKVILSNGDSAFLADQLTDGPPNPHEILSVFFNFYKNSLSRYEAAKLSLQKVRTYLVDEVQSVYQSQGVDISDKHIETIVRRMTSKVQVEDGGDTTFLPGEFAELQQIENINEAMILAKGSPAVYSPVLLGITKSSLNTDSFMSAASFQETTRVLTEAAIGGTTDWLRGLKENVIIGSLIPAGTGAISTEET